MTPLRVSPDWKIRSRTRVERVEPYEPGERDRCGVTFISLDVTERLIDAARRMLEQNTKAIDAKVATVNLREKVEEWWAVVQQPVRLSDSVWLTINPVSVHVDPATGSRKILRTGIGMLAEPRIVLGPRPIIPPVVLPKQVSASEAPEGFHILLEGVLPYDLASKL